MSTGGASAAAGRPVLLSSNCATQTVLLRCSNWDLSGRKGERWTKENEGGSNDDSFTKVETKMIVKKVRMVEVKIEPLHLFF